MLEQQRLTAVHAFSIAALGFNCWIVSPGAKEDVAMDFWALQQGKEDPRVDPTEQCRNLAAMRIMQTLAYSIDACQPIAILPEISGAEDLYKSTDEVIERVGLNHLQTYDMNIIGPPIGCFLRDITPETKVDSVLQQVRLARGTVKEEMTTIEEMAEAMGNAPEEETLEDLQVLPNGMLAEIHRFAKSPTKIVETPFYRQYISPYGGAETYLQAFLEDVQWVSSQF